MNNSKDERTDVVKWSDIARKWINYLPPFRPTVIDILNYRKVVTEFLSERSRINALVLGATPEFRDLLHEMKASVSIVDHNPMMIKEMSELRVYDNKEALFVDDWFKFLKGRHQEFHVIMSDLTQGNVPFEWQEEYYQLISNALIPGGVFIDRVFAFRDRSQLFNADDEFLKASKASVINLHILNEVFYKCFCASDLLFEIGKVDMGKFYSIMRQDYNNPTLKKMASLLDKYIASEEAVWHSGKDWDEMSKTYFSHLHLVTEFTDTDPSFNGIPSIIVSKPK